jgi:hypothetical protein
MDERTRQLWWWNGRWGHLARRDVFVHLEDGNWSVQAREGGAEGRTAVWQFDDRDQAVAAAKNLMDKSGMDGWRSVPVDAGH